MARIRTIKPEFWANDRLSALSVEAHFLAAALLNYADDFGYFNANPGLIRAAICPLRETFGNIPELLRSLQTIDYVRLAEGSDGRLYGWIVAFSEHQKVSHPTASKIAGLADFPESSGKLQNVTEPFRPERKGTGNREQGIDSSAPTKPEPKTDDFDKFYSAYPRKKHRGDAEKAWKALKPNAELLAVMLAAIESAKQSEDWQRDNGQFIPYPASWLRAKGWEDEYQPKLPLSNGGVGSTAQQQYSGFERFSAITKAPNDWTPEQIARAAKDCKAERPDLAERVDAWLAANMPEVVNV